MPQFNYIEVVFDVTDLFYTHIIKVFQLQKPDLYYTEGHQRNSIYFLEDSQFVIVIICLVSLKIIIKAVIMDNKIQNIKINLSHWNKQPHLPHGLAPTLCFQRTHQTKDPFHP